MIIKIESDIHLGFNPEYVPKLDNIDLYILAGDISEKSQGVEWCLNLLNENKDLHIIYVNGNHEYYCKKSNMEKIEASQKELASQNSRLHFLQNDSVVLNGIRFIGSTMWTDFDGMNPTAMSRAWANMNDFYQIRYLVYHKLTPYRVAKMFRDSKDYVFRTLKSSTEKCVVITHHKPYLSKVNPDTLSSAYEVDLEKELHKCMNTPLVWISGHTHSAEDVVRNYSHGDIRFISNGLGYPNEESGFNPDFVYILTEDV